MSRGKHARATAVLREAHQQEAEIGVYQRKNVELLNKVKELEETIRTRNKAHQAEAGRLNAMIREGASPALAVAERENKTLREERDHAMRQLADIQKKWGKANQALHEHAKNQHGMGMPEAFEWVLQLIGEPHTVRNLPKGPPKPESPEEEVRRVLTIQRARGERRAST